MVSYTHIFALLIYTRIPKYSTARWGSSTNWSHIHRNHPEIIESVKIQIGLSTIVEYKDGMPTYLHFLQDAEHCNRKFNRGSGLSNKVFVSEKLSIWSIEANSIRCIRCGSKNVSRSKAEIWWAKASLIKI